MSDAARNVDGNRLQLLKWAHEVRLEVEDVMKRLDVEKLEDITPPDAETLEIVSLSFRIARDKAARAHQLTRALLEDGPGAEQ